MQSTELGHGHPSSCDRAENQREGKQSAAVVTLPAQNRCGCISVIHCSLHKTPLASKERKPPRSNSCVLAESILPWATLLHGYKCKATEMSYCFEITIEFCHCSSRPVLLFKQPLMAGA